MYDLNEINERHGHYSSPYQDSEESYLKHAAIENDSMYQKREIAPQMAANEPTVVLKEDETKELLQFTANDIDGAYFLGVFNTSGIDGLSNELKRIKELGYMPHQIMHMLKVSGNNRYQETKPPKAK